jgi:hypothetical protein
MNLLIDVVVSISDSDSTQRSEYPGSIPGSASFCPGDAGCRRRAASQRAV